MAKDNWTTPIEAVIKTLAPEHANEIEDTLEMLCKRMTPEQLDAARKRWLVACVAEAKRHTGDPQLLELADLVLDRHQATAAGKTPEEFLDALIGIERAKADAAAALAADPEADQARALAEHRNATAARETVEAGVVRESQLRRALAARSDLGPAAEQVLAAIEATLDREPDLPAALEAARAASVARQERDLAFQLAQELFAALKT